MLSQPRHDGADHHDHDTAAAVCNSRHHVPPADPQVHWHQYHRFSNAERGATWMLYVHRHHTFILVEALLLLLALGLDVLVALHPGPLPGDVGSTLTLQHLLLPHKTLTLLINQTSELTWPIAATLTTMAVVGLLLVLRRWLDALLIAVIPGLGSATSYLTTLVVHRPRPLGHGLYIQMMVKGFYSFPSGHVEHALVFFGLLVFLTYQVRRPSGFAHMGWWVWPLRLALVAVIVLIGPSRMLEGEHWLSDVVAGYLYGAFWLLLGIYVYGWVARRWPRLLGSGEQKSATA